ncbi:MAG TPA: hypothetical protein VFY71_08790 [Planctomycetota bacterium]|nr:hypothetical protein [Planctomycetota bacterium]
MASDEVIKDWSDLEALVPGPFVPGPDYEPETDILDVYLVDEAQWADYLDNRLGIKRSMETNAVTGCVVHSVRRRLLPIIKSLALDGDDGAVTVKAVLLAAVMAAADDDAGSRASRRSYVEALAPICHAVGNMTVDLAD